MPHHPDSPVQHLSRPREGVPPVADTAVAVRRVAEVLGDGRGPIAVDTERASGFRFDDRAYLVQVRREGAGTHLVDPALVPGAGDLLAPVMNDSPWILHAGHSDLPALTSLGWRTPQLHDTQVAGRLLGYGQVGLAGMLGDLLGVTVAKDKGREDWSARPIPTAMLSYAALDVELLIELLDTAMSRLTSLGRAEWYHQECQRIRVDWSHPVQPQDWRELRGIGSLRNRRGLEVARRLTEERTRIARERDIPPEQVLRSSSLLDVAKSPSQASRQLSRPQSGGRRVDRAARTDLLQAVQDALAADSSTLPTLPRSGARRPDHRHWAQDYPRAHALLQGFRGAVGDLSGDTGIRVEDLIVIRHLRSVAWDVSQASVATVPGSGSEDPVGDVENLLGSLLQDCGCRPWQLNLLVPVLLPVVVDLLG
ncbi:HRDC domain-containing protein [Candidatus Corynebacterium faecigallinarum]|uniref:HRDC domain-containing protein n=1 Tax=Candidatus Corynebacterium faecigallinarum TaxID=2838528 RepID=UPI00264A5EF9|nr:HRDC domain-containing protein [Corynebacterium sp.]